MQTRPLRLVFVLVCLALGIGLIVSRGWAGDTGVLRLKVRQCLGSNWISGADVEVSIQRSGSGEVDSAKGTTDSAGYVEFTFYDLEDDDEAHVTVTSSGMNPDASHVYYWIASGGRESGNFALTTNNDSICDDGWYDLTNRIFLTKYH